MKADTDVKHIETVEELVEFMMQCYMERNNKANTIGGKLSALAYYHKLWAGIQIPTTHFLIQAVKKGMIRKQAEQGGFIERIRKGITWEQICGGHKCGIWAARKGGLLTWYGIAISYILLTRASELWADDKSGEINSSYGLRRLDLTFEKGGRILEWNQREGADAVSVHFRASKSDQKRIGTNITRKGACLRIILEMLRLYPALPRNAPLVAYAKSNENRWATITRREATEALRAMLVSYDDMIDPMQYALHSGRIGAASCLAATGMSDATIMIAGRWKSDAFKVYVRQNMEHAKQVSAALV